MMRMNESSCSRCCRLVHSCTESSLCNASTRDREEECTKSDSMTLSSSTTDLPIDYRFKVSAFTMIDGERVSGGDDKVQCNLSSRRRNNWRNKYTSRAYEEVTFTPSSHSPSSVTVPVDTHTASTQAYRESTVDGNDHRHRRHSIVHSLPFYTYYINSLSSSSSSPPPSLTSPVHTDDHVKLTSVLNDDVTSPTSSSEWSRRSRKMATLVRWLSANDTPLSLMQIDAPSHQQRQQRQQQQQTHHHHHHHQEHDDGHEGEQQVLTAGTHKRVHLKSVDKWQAMSRESTYEGDMKHVNALSFTRGAAGTRVRPINTAPTSPVSSGDSTDTASSYGSDLKRSLVIAGSALRTIVKGLVSRGESITSASTSPVNVSTCSSSFTEVEDDSLPLTTGNTRDASRLHCQVTRNRIDREYKLNERTQTWYQVKDTSGHDDDNSGVNKCSTSRKHSKRQNAGYQMKSSNKVARCDGNKDESTHQMTHRASCNSGNGGAIVSSCSVGETVTATFSKVTQSYSVDAIDRLTQRSPSETTAVVSTVSTKQVSAVTSSEQVTNGAVCCRGEMKKAIHSDTQRPTTVDQEYLKVYDEVEHTRDKQGQLNEETQNEEAVNERLSDHQAHSVHTDAKSLSTRSRVSAESNCNIQSKRRSRINVRHLKKCNSNFEMGTFFHSTEKDDSVYIEKDEDDDVTTSHCSHSGLLLEEAQRRRSARRRRSIDFGVSASQYSFAIEEEEEDAEEEKRKPLRPNVFDERVRREVGSQAPIADSCCRGSGSSSTVESAVKSQPRTGETVSESILSVHVSPVTSELTHRHGDSVSKKCARIKSTCTSGVAIHESTEGCDEEPHHQMLTSRLSYPDDTFTFNSTKNLSNICSNDSFILAQRHSTSTGGTSDSSTDDSHQEETIDYSKSTRLQCTSKKNKRVKKYIPPERRQNTTKSATVHSFTSFFSTLSSSAVAVATTAAPSFFSSSTRGVSSTSSSSFTSSSASVHSFTSRSLVNSVIAKCTRSFSSQHKHEQESLYVKSPADTLNRRLLTGRSMSQSSIESSTSLSPESDSIKFCSLCFESLPREHFFTISSCKCSFCRECLTFYLKNLIRENSVHIPFITCPDSECPKSVRSSRKRTSVQKLPSLMSSLSLETIKSTSGLKASLSFLQRKESKRNDQTSHSPTSNYLSFLENNASNLISPEEVCSLVDESTYKLYVKLKIEFEVRSDPSKTFCPMPNCDNICTVIRPIITTAHCSSRESLKPCNTLVSLASAHTGAPITSIYTAAGHTSTVDSSVTSDAKAFPVYCEKCKVSFCFKCRSNYHPGTLCTSQSHDDLSKYLLAAANEQDGAEIKRCPRCSVWIERDDGCAQMMCRKCRFVFCWFCLKSLEDDFLLRHYDSGPCKNKLGHSRASVMWHRTQVLGIFAGFGVLLLLVAPLFLVAFPCIVCCSCCSKSKNCCKWIHEDDEFEEEDSQGNEEGPSFATFLPHE